MGYHKKPIDDLALTFQDQRKRRRHSFDSDQDTYDLPSRKRVRFVSALFGQPVTRSIPPDTLYCRLDKETLWWTREERKKMSDECRQVAEQFQEEAPNQVSHLLDVLDQCSQAPSKSSSEYLENVTIVLPSEVHGLQSFLMPCKARRMQHTQEVLTVQEQIQGRLSCDMRAQVLSARSMRSSRPTRVLARLLGEGHASSLTEEQSMCVD